MNDLRRRLWSVALVIVWALGLALGCPAAAPAPKVDYFNQDLGSVALSDDENEVGRMLRRVAADVDRAAPDIDPGLTLVARELAEQLKNGGEGAMDRVGGEALQEQMTRFGVSDSAIRTQMASALRLSDLDEVLGRAVREELASGRYTHFGVGIAKRWLPPTVYVMVIFSRRPVALEPFPKAVAAGERYPLAGTLLAGLNKPTVYIGRPSGTVGEVLLNVHPDGSFRTHLFFNDGPGIYRVEVVGEGSMGPEVVALMPVRVGDVPEQTEAADDRRAATEDEAARWVFDQINTERQRAGLNALRWDDRLAAIARAHAKDMRERHYAAHRSPTTGMVTDRADAAGIQWQRIAENVALNQTALAAHASIMESPAHRTNVIDPHFTLAGIGVAFGDDGHGHRLVYLVENYRQP